MVSAVAGEIVQFPSDTFAIRAWLVHPTTSAAQAPAIILIHEWWGLNDHIKDIARRCADAGFVALAPDLYSRLGNKVTKDPQEAARLMESLSSQAALRDLNAATTFLKQQPGVDPLCIGAVGFCTGGTFALTQAIHNSDLKAVAIFYGKVPPQESLARLLCPILYHHGAKDGWVTKQEVEQLRQGLAKYHKAGEVISYPNAEHAFFNDTRPEVYRSDEAQAAWQRTMQFFSTYLR